MTITDAVVPSLPILKCMANFAIPILLLCGNCNLAQANTFAPADYDKLSELHHEQSQTISDTISIGKSTAGLLSACYLSMLNALQYNNLELLNILGLVQISYAMQVELDEYLVNLKLKSNFDLYKSAISSARNSINEELAICGRDQVFRDSAREALSELSRIGRLMDSFQFRINKAK